MYSPKISKELVPQLYQLSKQQGLPMTELVAKMLREAIEKYRLEHEEGGLDTDGGIPYNERCWCPLTRRAGETKAKAQGQ